MAPLGSVRGRELPTRSASAVSASLVYSLVDARVSCLLQGKQAMQPLSHVVWPAVPFEEGELSCRGYLRGALVIEQTITTTGPAVSLSLSQRPSSDPEPFTADGMASLSRLALLLKRGRCGCLFPFQINDPRLVLFSLVWFFLDWPEFPAFSV